MEVHAGQKASTMTQAMAHNISTVERDLDMLEEVLKARKDFVALETVLHAHEHLRRAYANLLTQFGLEVANEVQDHEGHNPEHVGQERSFVAQAHHDAQLGRKFMTR